MDNPSLVLAISKLAAAGEQAGFSLEQMIDLLDAGLEVETLLELICWRLRRSSVAAYRNQVVSELGGVVRIGD
jgi:hypothetical protein